MKTDKRGFNVSRQANEVCGFRAGSNEVGPCEHSESCPGGEEVMRISPVILLLLMSTAAMAQSYPGMNAADMQKLQKMQTCMSKIDRGQMKALEQRQKQFDAQVKALCESGKRDEAQKKALLFEKEMTKDPTIQAVSKCSEIAKGMMSDMPFMKQGEKPSDKHVCDSY